MANGRPPPRRPRPGAPPPQDEALSPEAAVPTNPEMPALLAEPEITASRVQVPTRPAGRSAPPRPRLVTRPPSRRDRVPEPKKGGGLRLVLLTLLLLGGGGAGTLWWMKKNQPPPPPAAPPAPVESKSAAIAFQQGKNLAREGKWGEGKLRFEEALALDPELPGLAEYLARCATEIPNEEHLAAALAALEAGQLGAAAAALKKVSADTVQHDPLTRVKESLDAKLASRLTEARALASATKDLAAQRQLEALTSDLLAAQPDHRDAKSLSEQAKENIARLTHRSAPAKGPQGPGPWVEVSTHFRRGDVSGAFSVAEACAATEANCAILVKQLVEFQELNKKVEALDARGLERVVMLDVAIGGGSPAAQAARTRLTTQYYKVAASANQTGQWGRAWEYAAKVLELDSQHAGAQTIAAEAKSRAQNVFMTGYEYASRGENEEALKKFKECLSMARPGDELHSKCKRRVEQLGH